MRSSPPGPKARPEGEPPATPAASPVSPPCRSAPTRSPSRLRTYFSRSCRWCWKPGLRRLPLQLERGATLEGNFVDADDQKVAGAAISVRDPRQPERILAADTTNSEGYFRFAGIPAGKWHLVAAAPSWPPQTEDLEIGREELYRRDFQLPPGETLRGIVLTADRQPAAGAQVSLTDPERRMGSDMIFSLASMTTDGSGTFSFDKLGRHRLELSAWLPRHYTAHREVLPGKDQFVEIVLDPPPP